MNRARSLLLLTVSCASFVACSGGAPTVESPSTPPAAASSASAAAPPPSFRSVRLSARGFAGVGLLSDTVAAHLHHTRITSKESGQIVEEIGAGGDVLRRNEVSLPAGGVFVVQTSNRYGDKDGRSVLDAGGIYTRVNRAGVTGAAGCHHQKLVFDVKDRVVTITCFDDAGHVIGDDDGCEITQTAYDDKDREVRIDCRDAEGKPLALAGGSTATTITYSDDGLEAISTFLDASGTPRPRAGCATTEKAHYDEAGNTTVDTFFGPRRKSPTCYEKREAFDGNACTISREYVGPDGKPYSLDEDDTSTTYKRGPACESLEEQSVRGKSSSWPSRVLSTLDDHGMQKERRCFNGASLPSSCTTGETDKPSPIGSVLRFTYDDRGRVTSMSGYLPTGEPSGLSAGRAHEARFSYAENGTLSGVRDFDEKGAPAADAAKLHELAFVRDWSGKELDESAFDAHHAPLDIIQGCHEIRRAYDEHHRLKLVECRDSAGKLKNASAQSPIDWHGGARIVVDHRSASTILNTFFDASEKAVDGIGCSPGDGRCQE